MIVFCQDFESELLWCIEQLEIGLSNGSKTKNKRQEADAIKALKASNGYPLKMHVF